MTRRILGFASLLSTLFASGCMSARALRSDVSAHPAPLPGPSHAAMKSPEVVPASLAEPAEKLAKDSPKGSGVAPSPNWSQFLVAPPPPPAQLPSLPQKPEPIASPMPPPEPVLKYPIVRALDCSLDNRPDEALKHLKHYDAKTQELFLRMLPMISLLSKKPTLGAGDIAALNVQLAAIGDFLQQNSEFQISKVCFCESIKEFGIYKELAPDHEFLASRPGLAGERIELYVGFKNFASQPQAGEFATRITSRVDIRGSDGKLWPVFAPDLEKFQPRIRLHEYYSKYSFYLPQLPPGAYTLVVEMTDETVPGARRSDTRSLPFRVAAP